jgi:hypothetical protein
LQVKLQPPCSVETFIADPDQDPWEAPSSQVILRWSQVLFNLVILDSVVGPDPDPDPYKILVLSDPDPLVRGADPDPDPSIMKPIIVGKPQFLLLCDFFMTFYL